MQILERIFMYLKNEVKGINFGGCGVAALSMYRFLKRNNQLDYNSSFAFIYYSDSYNDLLINELILNDHLKELPHVPNHVVLNLCGVLFDSDGVFTLEEDDRIQLIPFDREDFIIDTINNLDYWSNEFDRRQIDTISKELDIDLSDILINSYEFCTSNF